MGLDSCIVTCVHHCSFVQSSSTALKTPCAHLLAPPPQLWKPLIVSLFAQCCLFQKVREWESCSMEPFRSGFFHVVMTWCAFCACSVTNVHLSIHPPNHSVIQQTLARACFVVSTDLSVRWGGGLLLMDGPDLCFHLETEPPVGLRACSPAPCGPLPDCEVAQVRGAALGGALRCPLMNTQADSRCVSRDHMAELSCLLGGISQHLLSLV